MKIRKVTKKDFEYMAKLIVKEFAKPPYNDKWTKKEAIDSIKSDLSKGESYVAEEGNKIAGFIVVTKQISGKTYLFIENLVVDENYQRRGIGKKLVEEIERRYIKKRDVVISLSVNKKSMAYKFYKKLKYKENKNNINMSKKLK